MKTFLSLAVLLLMIGCASYQVRPPASYESNQYIYDYSLNLTDRSADLFKVELNIPPLSAENNAYQFAVTVPGTYSLLNIGRYVQSFKAFDKFGTEIGVQRVSVNRFHFEQPQKVRRIVYEIEDTWDSQIDSNKVPLMGGTSIENDNVLLNPHAVFGYIEGMQEKPVRLKIKYPKEWQVGTPAYKRYKNYFFMDNYRELIHSPMLFGRLTSARLSVQDINVEIFAWSKTNKITAEQLTWPVKKAVSSVTRFIDRKPANYYTFLFHFEEKSAGAHEHPNSSLYVLREQDFKRIKLKTTEIAAHEFYHLETPFRIREKGIAAFNFRTPETTEHLWFYEGVTEWASNMALLRYGVTTIGHFFSDLSFKIRDMHQLNSTVSLLDISNNSYSKNENYHYMYTKGAVTAAMLDLQILEASGGEKGLQDVVNALAKKYTGDHPFASEDFFNEVVQLSDPSVRGFIDNYIIGNEELPIKDLFSKIGIRYLPKMYDKRGRSALGYAIIKDEISGKMVLKMPDERAEQMGFLQNDTLLTINDSVLNKDRIETIFDSLKIMTEEKGVPYTALVKRGAKKIKIQAKTLLLRFDYIFSPMHKRKHDFGAEYLFKKWRSI